jgi:hypothetical protein
VINFDVRLNQKTKRDHKIPVPADDRGYTFSVSTGTTIAAEGMSKRNFSGCTHIPRRLCTVAPSWGVRRRVPDVRFLPTRPSTGVAQEWLLRDHALGPLRSLAPPCAVRLRALITPMPILTPRRARRNARLIKPLIGFVLLA